MLQRTTILQYLKEAVEAIEDPRVPTNKTIVFPNEPIEERVYSQDVFFELFCGGVKPENETENSAVSTIVGSIVLNCKTNVGVSYLDALADALVYFFNPANPYRKNGFRTCDDRDDNTIDVYVANVERSETGSDNGRYKCTIFVTFEVYEGL